MMPPISSSLRLNASPRRPPGNSSSSFAIAWGSLDPRAIPSPDSMTRPTSSRSIDGLQLSTFLRSASAIEAGSRLSAISDSAPRCVLGVLETAGDRAVEDEVPDARDHAADEGWIDNDLRFDRPSGGPRKCLLETLALPVVQRDRASNLG